jgi:hypothetical protein
VASTTENAGGNARHAKKNVAISSGSATVTAALLEISPEAIGRNRLVG